MRGKCGIEAIFGLRGRHKQDDNLHSKQNQIKKIQQKLISKRTTKREIMEPVDITIEQGDTTMTLHFDSTADALASGKFTAATLKALKNCFFDRMVPTPAAFGQVIPPAKEFASAAAAPAPVSAAAAAWEASVQASAKRDYAAHVAAWVADFHADLRTWRETVAQTKAS